MSNHLGVDRAQLIQHASRLDSVRERLDKSANAANTVEGDFVNMYGVFAGAIIGGAVTLVTRGLDDALTSCNSLMSSMADKVRTNAAQYQDVEDASIELIKTID